MKKNLRTLALSLIASAAAFQASAYTMEDLVNANCSGEDYAIGYEVVNTPRLNNGTYNFSYGYASSGEIILYKNSEGLLVIDGLLKGNIYSFFKISGSYIESQVQPTYMYDCNTEKPVSGGAGDYSYNFGLRDVVYNSYYNSYRNSGYLWGGTISEDEESYTITFNPLKLTFYNNSGYSLGDNYFDAINIIIPKESKYEFNANVTDRLKSVDRSYPAHVEIDWNTGKFYMENFACSGLAIHSSLTSINTCESTLTGITGTITPTTPTSGTITLPKQQVQADVKVGTSTITHYQVHLCPANATAPGASVYGTYTVQDYSHRDADRWHKNSGGNLVTERLLNVELDDYKMMTSDGYVNLQPWYNTKMEIADEYTADPTFGTYTVTTSEGWLHFNVNIAEKNEAHVGDYDLYIVPGTKSTIAGDSEFLHTNHGHARAININQLGEVPATAAAAASTNGVVNVTRVVAPEDFKDFGWSDDEISEARKGNFSMYIRARYNNSNLEHTYHNLTPVRNTVTGIEEVAASSSLAARGGNGIITIEGTSSLIEVYNLSGVCVYSGYNTEIEVNPGLYIVRADNQTVKVSVR